MTTRADAFNMGGLAAMDQYRAAPDDFYRQNDVARANADIVPDTGMNLFAAGPQEAPQIAAAQTQGVKDVANWMIPQSPLDFAAMYALGPGGKPAVKAGALALGALFDQVDPAQADVGSKIARMARSATEGYTRRYAPLGGEVNAGVDAPTNRLIQTVRDPYRMMYPGIYGNPREIAAEAGSRVIGENPLMQQLWGVTRGDLDAMAAGRVGNEAPRGIIPSQRGRGSTAADNVMTPKNEQRLQDILYEGGRIPGLAHADAWYIMDPVYQRLEQMFGPDEAVQRYRHLNTMMGMASPGSDVLTEIQRGTAAHWLQNQGRMGDFTRFGGVADANRGANFPADMQYIGGHPYHKTSQVIPYTRYLDTGELLSESPKVPLYVHASGTPQTGFQTSGPVGDAHFSRGVGLADTRKGPTDVGASFSRPEYETMTPWWRDRVAAPLGLESVPAQARLWTILGPQTGVDSPLGQGKLELFSQQIGKAANRLGMSPERARDLILSGGAGAGAVGALLPGIGSIAAQDQYTQ